MGVGYREIAFKKNRCFTLFPRSGERVIERLSDDRVSANEATLAPMHHNDYSPRLRYAGRPSPLRGKRAKNVKSDFLGVGMCDPFLWGKGWG